MALWNKAPLRERFFRFVGPASKPLGCHLWTGCVGKNGYGQIQSEKRPRLAHRVAYEIANGPIPDRMDVLHSCDNRTCVNPSHLSLGTDRENTDDKVRKGRHAHAETNGRAVLRWPQVVDIRRRFTAGYATKTQLARRFGVSFSTVSRIVKGEHWKEPAVVEMRGASRRGVK